MNYCKYVRSIYQKKYQSIQCATSLTESEPFKLLPQREDKWFLATFNGQKEQAMKMETESELKFCGGERGRGSGGGLSGKRHSQIHMSSFWARTTRSEKFVDFVIYAFNLMDFF